MAKTIHNLPNAEYTPTKPYTNDYIITKLGGLIQSDIELRENGILELILCQAIEIRDLKNKIKELLK